jgi:hypothetical protein
LRKSKKNLKMTKRTIKKIKDKKRNLRKMMVHNIITLRVKQIKTSSQLTILKTKLILRNVKKIRVSGKNYSQKMLRSCKNI